MDVRVYAVIADIVNRGIKRNRIKPFRGTHENNDTNRKVNVSATK